MIPANGSGRSEPRAIKSFGGSFRQSKSNRDYSGRIPLGRLGDVHLRPLTGRRRGVRYEVILNALAASILDAIRDAGLATVSGAFRYGFGASRIAPILVIFNRDLVVSAHS
jgi:hypothetical protein